MLPRALLAVAVLLAGCGASVGSLGEETMGSMATSTQSAAETSTANTTSDTPSLPPGGSETGVDDPLALTSAHATVLADTSFAVAVSTTERDGAGTIRTRERTNATFAKDKDRYVVDHVTAGSDPSMMDASAGSLSIWADGERIYQRTVIGGSTAYQLLYDANGDLREPREHVFADQIEDDRLYVLFSAFDWSVETVNRDGATDYRLTTDELSNPSAVAASFDLDGIERASMTATVDSRGIVHEYSVEYAGSVGNRTVRGIHEVEYDEVGSATVERPAWVDEAENATSE